MALTVQVPEDYGYVVLTAAASFVMTNYASYMVGGLRKAAKLPYPNTYFPREVAEKDPKAYAFNCGQRAQANTVENYTPVVLALLIAGLSFPRVSAGLGAAWIVSRFLYMRGYSRDQMGNGGQGRSIGLWGFLPHFALQGLALWTGFTMVRSS